MINKIWFHADDYGLTKTQSEKILECYTKGALNSISVIPNSLNLAETCKLLNELDSGKEIRRVLHLNFVEGRPLSDLKDVSMLVDEMGYFDKSFIQYFKWNLIKSKAAKKELSIQLKTEIRNQLRAVTGENDFKISAIDSHQHYHMIPIVFDSMIEVLEEDEFRTLKIEDIRISVDPLAPIFRKVGVLFKVPVINWIKWLILSLHANRNKRILKGKNITTPVFCGIFFTCEMKYEIVKELFPLYKKYADKKGAALELMFHPGGLEDKKELLDIRRGELEEFYMSNNRELEAYCLKNI